MDLADDRVVKELLTGHWTPRQQPSNALPEIRPAARRRRCQCGQCPACLDNVRWQRIFDEKFADPDYYHRSHVPQGSSLNWL